jgi:hypothetical protein
VAETDYYTTLHRSMFARINEVGAKPFLLFQYYLTYRTAPKISPSLKTIALDMGIVDKQGKPQISAVSHLKKELIEAGWVEEKDGEILITLVEKNSTAVEKISSRKLRKSQQVLRNSQPPYIRNEKEKEIEIKKDSLSTPARFQASTKNLEIEESRTVRRNDSLADNEALKLLEETFKITVGNHFAEAIADRIKNIDVWRALIRDKISFADRPQSQRERIPNWIFSAYDEKLEKEAKKNGNSTEISRNQTGPDRTAGKSDSETIRNRVRARKPTDVRVS